MKRLHIFHIFTSRAFQATHSLEICIHLRSVTAVDTIFNESLAKSIRAAVNAPGEALLRRRARYIICTSGRSWRVSVRGAFTKRIHEDLRVNRAASYIVWLAAQNSLPVFARTSARRVLTRRQTVRCVNLVDFAKHQNTAFPPGETTPIGR